MRKKLFAILMSAMMMVTFMPSMAFAVSFEAPKNPTAAEAEAKAVAEYFAEHPHEIKLLKGTTDKPVYLTYKTTGNNVKKVECDVDDRATGEDYNPTTGNFTVKLTANYNNPNMKAVGKKVHLACGQDLQVYQCQTAHCGYETYAYLDNRSYVAEETLNHPSATNEEMSLEAFVQKYVKEQADALLAELNIADTLVDGAVVVAGGAYLTEQAFENAVKLAARTAASNFRKFMSHMAPYFEAKKVEAIFNSFFMSLSPWGIAKNAGRTAGMMTAMAQAVARGTIDATMGLMGILGTAAAAYYGTEDIYGLQNVCKLIVTTCPDCGILDVQIVGHKNSKGKCASNFVCDNCGKKIWNVNNLFNANHAKIKVVDTGKEYRDENDLVLLAGKIDVEKLDCATTISYKCADCGESMISLPILKKEGHDLQPTTLIAATRLTKGIDADKCTKCGLITNVRLTDKIQHTHDKDVEEVVAPTCSMPGYTVVKCSCGQLMGVKSVVAPKKHEYKTETLVEPTCESGGIFRIYCANCDASKVILGSSEKTGRMYDLAGVLSTEKLDTLDKLSFELSDRIGEGDNSVVEDLLDLLTKWSGYTKTDVFENGTGHIDFIKVMTAKSTTYDPDDAFDVEGGRAAAWKTTYYFTGFGYCGFTDACIEVKDVSVVNDGEHDFSEVDKLPGMLPSFKNANHGVVTVESNNYVKVADATCTTPALWAVACKKCGMYDVHKLHGTNGVFEVGTANGHKYDVEEVAATCEHKAGTISVCATCGDRVVTGLDEIKGGKCVPSGDWVTTKDATFTKVGTRVMYCVNCEQICKYDDVAVKKLGKAYQPTLKAGKKQFTAKFKNVGSAATGVQIAYKVTGTNNYKYIKTEFKKSKTVKGLKGGKKYTVKVRKYKVEDGKTVYGAWCAVKYVTTKK